MTLRTRIRLAVAFGAIGAIGAFVVSALALSQRVTAQAPPTTTAARPAATGTIRGRVVALDTGQPLRRARLLLRLAVPPPGGQGPIDVATSNAVGLFEFKAVPPGHYRLVAERSGYLEVEYGQRRPREPGHTIELGDGATLERVDVTMPKTSVLGGRITDERGGAYVGMRVEAYELRYAVGQRLPRLAAAATTDDRGQYRIPSLEPGSYYVSVASSETWIGSDGATYGYVPTYFPGVTADQAQAVDVAIGQQRTDISFSVRPERTARVSGRVQRTSGQSIAGETIAISQELGNRLRQLASVRTARDGTFEFQELPPGIYRVGSTGQDGNGRQEDGSVRLGLRGSDVNNVVVIRSVGSTVSGVIITDTGMPPGFALSSLRVNGLRESALGTQGFATYAVESDGAFRFDALSPVLIRLNGLPEGWMLKSIKRGDTEIPEGFLDVQRGRNIDDLRIVLSSKVGRLSGEVVNADGKPTSDAAVVLFPDNDTLVVRGSRYLRTTRPDLNGHFTIGGLPAGKYRVAVREYVEDGAAEAAEYLASLKPSSTLFELTEGGSQTLTLKLPR